MARVIHREYQQFWGPWAAPGFINGRPQSMLHVVKSSIWLLHSFTPTQVWVFDLSPVFPSTLLLQGNKHWWLASALFRIPISSLPLKSFAPAVTPPFSCENMGIFMNISPLSPVSWIFHLLLDFVSFSVKACSMLSHLQENRISSFPLTTHPASVSVLFGCLVSSAEFWAASARKWCLNGTWAPVRYEISFIVHTLNNKRTHQGEVFWFGPEWSKSKAEWVTLDFFIW